MFGEFMSSLRSTDINPAIPDAIQDVSETVMRKLVGDRSVDGDIHEEGFAPLKNASGAQQDTPEMVKHRMVAQHRRWLEQAGVELAGAVDVEIGPLWALDAEEAAQKIEPGTRVTEARYFC